jgi:hypothetical protein
VGPSTVLDAVVKRKIPSPRRESNPRNPIVRGNLRITIRSLLATGVHWDQNRVHETDVIFRISHYSVSFSTEIEI